MFCLIHLFAQSEDNPFFGDRLENGSPYAVGPLSCPVCLSVLSVCDVGVLWQNGWMDQDETWHGGRPKPQPYCVRPPPKGAQPPIFGPCLLWPNGSMDQDATW